ncbi:hypothetical protein Bbelb_134010 [Branchiostoma belcheri]|nr:hypothetical protein Bbelb_134010 [Branchiostoma belcheri]
MERGNTTLLRVLQTPAAVGPTASRREETRWMVVTRCQQTRPLTPRFRSVLMRRGGCKTEVGSIRRDGLHITHGRPDSPYRRPSASRHTPSDTRPRLCVSPPGWR